MLEFKRIKQQNFYVAKVGNHTILKSYNTIVGIIINEKLYQVKYSRTTSKQVSQFCNNCSIYDRYELIGANDLQDIIKSTTGLDIDTRYNRA